MKIIFSILFCMAFCVLAAQQGNGHVRAGNEAYRAGDYQRAIDEYQKALAKEPANAAAKFNLGNALERQKHSAGAVKQYDDLLENEKDPALITKAYYNKGLALLAQQDVDGAIDAFKKALSLAPDDNDIRENLQKALNERKQKQQQQQQQHNKQRPNNDKKPPQKQPNRQMMEQKFNDLENQEKQLRKQLQKKQVESQPEKDW